MGHVIGVLGASGGLGASTLVCALAGAAARAGLRSVAVDGRLLAGGLDITACCEHAPGYRWGDLAELEGTTDGERLLGRLPSVGDVSVLSAGGRAPGREVAAEVLRALGAAADVVVVDLPPVGAGQIEAADPPGTGRVQAALLVAGLTPRRLADARAVAAVTTSDGSPSRLRGMVEGEVAGRRAESGTPLGLVTRGARRIEEVGEAAAAHLGLPFVAHVADDPRVVLDEGRGQPAGSRGRGCLARAAERALVWVGGRPDVGAS